MITFNEITFFLILLSVCDWLFLQYIGPQFLSAIRPILGQDWTEETEKAWTLLLDYMTATMKESLLEARNGSAAKSLKPQTLPPSLSSSSTAAMDD